MTTPPNDTIAAQPEIAPAGQSTRKKLAKSYRKMVAQAGRVRVLANGSRQFLRFSQVEIFEHRILLIAFAVLAVTGLLIKFASVDAFAPIIHTIFGSLGTLKMIHDVFAVIFSTLALFHSLRIFYLWIVKREPGSLMPQRQDWVDLKNLLLYYVRPDRQHPASGRFTIEEKITYWVLLLIVLLMIPTGLLQLFSMQVLLFLPANVVLVARTVHGLTTLLAVMTLVPWFLYHVVVKGWNSSVFTGFLSEETMRRNHLLDYQQIMKAYEEIRAIQQKAIITPQVPSEAPADAIPAAAKEESVRVPINSREDEQVLR